MIGICQGQTELSSPLLPTVGLSLTPPDRTCPVRLCRERICIGAVPFFGPEFCFSFRSTAKRDQSFICTYPAWRPGFHGRLSLGNPPASKQCFRCIGKVRPPLHRPVTARTGGNSR